MIDIDAVVFDLIGGAALMHFEALQVARAL